MGGPRPHAGPARRVRPRRHGNGATLAAGAMEAGGGGGGRPAPGPSPGLPAVPSGPPGPEPRKRRRKRRRVRRAGRGPPPPAGRSRAVVPVFRRDLGEPVRPSVRPSAVSVGRCRRRALPAPPRRTDRRTRVRSRARWQSPAGRSPGAAGARARPCPTPRGNAELGPLVLGPREAFRGPSESENKRSFP